MNYFRETVELTEDTHLVGCNLVLASVVTNGFAFSYEECNARGLRIDGVKQDDFVLRTYKPDADAVALSEVIDRWCGADGAAAWSKVRELIALDYGTAYHAFQGWAMGPSLNTVSFPALVECLLGYLVLADWSALCVLVASKTEEAWRGEAVILVEEVE